ncbi:MAG: DUF799 domain-containing protein [Enterobacteriaceae bacterium]|jgi:hypothetical protein|nr:DUF799 domain-containing protein [Enterobacteriaceae bacterium]
MKRIIAVFGLFATLLLTGCVQPTSYDYSAFKQYKPKSILVVLPQNNSPDINASHSVLAQATRPLAESGYYVFPVAVVDEMFKQNGVTNSSDIQAINPAKLKEIFNADSALYITVTSYGTAYQIINSDTRVTANAKLVDLASGTTLWSGSATASSTEGDSYSDGWMVLINAAITQITSTISDKSYQIAGIATSRLLSANNQNGILYGPRSPQYGHDAQ